MTTKIKTSEYLECDWCYQTIDDGDSIHVSIDSEGTSEFVEFSFYGDKVRLYWNEDYHAGCFMKKLKSGLTLGD